MKNYTYKGFIGQDMIVDLIQLFPPDRILHATPDENVAGIKEHGLKIGMPQVKCVVDVPAIWATIPSKEPKVADLFRFYDNWSIVVIDPSKLPNHIWYEDFLGQKDTSNNGENKHIMTFQDIPVDAIIKIIKP